MKKWRIRIVLFILAAVAVLLLARPAMNLWNNIQGFPTSSADDLKGYLRVYGASLEALSQNAGRPDYLTSQEGASLLHNIYQSSPSLRQIKYKEEGDIILSFAWTYDVEKNATLRYCPHGVAQIAQQWNIENAPSALQPDEEIRRDGLGINQEGYIRILCIQENWYFIESYLPT